MSTAEKPDPPSRLKAWGKRAISIRDSPSYFEGLLFGTSCIGIVFFIWWLITAGEGDARWIDVSKLPSPRETFSSITELWNRGLSRSIVISLARVLGGFTLAAAIGVPLGIVAGSYPRVNAFFKPLVIFGRSIPIAALIPLTLLWFGIGDFNKVMFIFLATIAFVIFDTVNTVNAVPDRFIDTAYTLGARSSRKKGFRIATIIGSGYGCFILLVWHGIRVAEGDASSLLSLAAVKCFAIGFVLGFFLWFPIAGHQVLRKVILPLALPDIVNSLRLIFGLAFGYIMLAEVINPKSGIGSLIILSERRGFHEHTYLCLLIITLLAWGIDRSIKLLQRQLFPYIDHGEN
jgi:ABC-type nitrate/sulfonate/bicarbonate transport system permease component